MKNGLIKFSVLVTLVLTNIFPLSVLSATTGSFSDVPANHPNFAAIEFLKNEGIISGYPDGTFRPAQVVNRAEALKIVLNAKSTPLNNVTATSFKDIAPSDWFAQYVETAKTLKIVSGNPDGTFAPARTVNKVEFLKMLLLTYDVQFVNYKLPTKPLYPDAADNTQWYIPYLDFAKNINLIVPNAAGNIEPDKGLTRGEVAEIVYKMIVVIRGGPVQLLLSRSEALLMQSIFDLQANALDDAAADIKAAKELASQALEKAPDEAIVKAALKVIEAFESLVTAFKQAAAAQNDLALQSAGTAYNTAEEARVISSAVENLALQVKAAAKSLADDIRTRQ
jgi:hypothetical protein